MCAVGGEVCGFVVFGGGGGRKHLGLEDKPLDTSCSSMSSISKI